MEVISGSDSHFGKSGFKRGCSKARPPLCWVFKHLMNRSNICFLSAIFSTRYGWSACGGGRFSLFYVMIARGIFFSL